MARPGPRGGWGGGAPPPPPAGAKAEAAGRIGWLRKQAQALGVEGWCRLRTGDFRGAIAALDRQVALQEARGSRRDLAIALGNLGTAWDGIDEIGKARAAQERSLALAREATDRAGEAAAEVNLGRLDARVGEPEKAAARYRRAMAIAEETGDEDVAARASGNLGLVLVDLGDFAGARAAIERTKAVLEKAGDELGVAQSVGNLGFVARHAGDTARSISLYEEAVERMEALGSKPGVVRFLGNLGSVRLHLGDHARALACFARARALAEQVGMRADVARLLGNEALVHAWERTPEGDARASALQERALRIQEAIGDAIGRSQSLVALAELLERRGDFDGAIARYEEGLGIQVRLGARPLAAHTMQNLGLQWERKGEREKARDFYRRALAEADELGLPDVAARCLSDLAGLDMLAGRLEESLALARRGAETVLELAGGHGEEQGAIAREHYLEVFEIGLAAAAAAGRAEDGAFFVESARAGVLLEALGGRDAVRAAVVPARLRLLEASAEAREAAALARHRAALATGNRAAIRDARAAWDAAREEVRAAVDRVEREARAQAGISRPRPLSLARIEAQLRPDEVMVLFAWLPRNLWALVVQRDAAHFHRVGASLDAVRADVDALAADDPASDPRPAAERLKSQVLAPLHAWTSHAKRILVSPDGPLCRVPFSLLIDGPEVVHVPSGTVLALLRESPMPLGDGVLALGDPDYGVVADPGAVAAHTRGGALRLSPLPATRREVEAVGDVVVTGRDFTEAGLRRAVAARPRWRAVHLACHGLVDLDRPAFSSLALTSDPAVEGGDGFLTALDVVRMSFSADLVTLSACETARGRVHAAGGTLGLPRAFMYAGASRVLCSLWKVDDEATRVLMTKFYERWKAGAPAAQALRSAQAHIRAEGRWAHPYYWAAWTLWGLP